MNSTIATGTPIQGKKLVWQTRNSTVYLVDDKHSSNLPKILKVVPIRPDNESEVRNQQFAATLSKDVVNLHSGQQCGAEFHIQMDWCSGGSLSEEIRRRAKSHSHWPSEELHNHALNLTKLMSVLHIHQLTHRDLKPDNFFLSSSGELKLGDFGSSHQGDHEVAERHGTVIYMPPELCAWKHTTVNYCQADSFSLGKTLYEMATLQLMDDLYSDYGDEAEYNRRLMVALDRVSEPLRQTILGLMVFDPTKRWSCTEAWKYLQTSADKSGAALSSSINSELSDSTASSSPKNEAYEEHCFGLPVTELSLDSL